MGDPEDRTRFVTGTPQPGADHPLPPAPRTPPQPPSWANPIRDPRSRAQAWTAARLSPGESHARLTFVLRLEPGGPMAPMINALMQPAMAIAAEDLAKRILAHVAASQRS